MQTHVGVCVPRCRGVRRRSRYTVMQCVQSPRRGVPWGELGGLAHLLTRGRATTSQECRASIQVRGGWQSPWQFARTGRGWLRPLPPGLFRGRVSMNLQRDHESRPASRTSLSRTSCGRCLRQRTAVHRTSDDLVIGFGDDLDGGEILEPLRHHRYGPASDDSGLSQWKPWSLSYGTSSGLLTYCSK